MISKQSFNESVLKNDEQLISLLRKGDQDAFSEVYNRYYPLLLRHAIGKLKDIDQAMDVVQDVFVKLWTKCPQLQIKSDLTSYLYQSVRYQILDLIKHEKVIDKYVDEILHFSNSNDIWADHVIREKQFAQMIEDEIQSLPPRMREVFLLRKVEKLSIREVAKRLAISENTVSDQLKKAMKIIRIKLGLIIIISHIINNLK